MKTKDYAYIGIFSVLLCVGAWITLPFSPPFTMQIFFLSLASGFLGPKRAAASVLIYLLMGAVGLPVFSGFASGAGVLFGITGGYITGFIPYAVISGYLCGKFKGTVGFILSNTAGLLACYLCGTVYYVQVFGGEILSAVALCVLPFILPDILKIILAALCLKRLKKTRINN